MYSYSIKPLNCNTHLVMFFQIYIYTMSQKKHIPFHDLLPKGRSTRHIREVICLWQCKHMSRLGAPTVDLSYTVRGKNHFTSKINCLAQKSHHTI